MKVTIELLAGNAKYPTKADIEKNIAVQRRAIETANPNDKAYLIDTLSILDAIKRKL